jgi:hypothetical protein
MYRCALLAFAASAACVCAHAQTHRPFTKQTLRGELVIQQTPDVTLNGKSARMAPGSRLRGDNNLLLQPASVAGQKLVVHYTVDSFGLLMDIWVLNGAELANKPWPTTAADAAAWTFNAATQTWSK